MPDHAQKASAPASTQRVPSTNTPPKCTACLGKLMSQVIHDQQQKLVVTTLKLMIWPIKIRAEAPVACIAAIIKVSACIHPHGWTVLVGRPDEGLPQPVIRTLGMRFAGLSQFEPQWMKCPSSLLSPYSRSRQATDVFLQCLRRPCHDAHSCRLSP